MNDHSYEQDEVELDSAQKFAMEMNRAHFALTKNTHNVLVPRERPSRNVPEDRGQLECLSSIPKKHVRLRFLLLVDGD